MKRTGIKRGTKPLRRRAKLKAKGRERGMPIPEFRAWIRTLMCALEMNPGGCSLHVQAAHLPRVKQHGDKRNLVPLCVSHHREQHRIGVRSFAAKYALDLRALADWYWERWLDVSGHTTDYDRQTGEGRAL